ncbi:MAG: winged helix-turn-helix transcriptional regulator [Oxalobacteraceae bacterium]|nr:winged helix-turn-helix transcriptional regulator [Oxalobacteraceae bacterium]
MEYRQLARLLGALCFEERLRIISALISASDEGLSQRELAEITELAPNAVWVHLDYMMGTDMVKSRSTMVEKIFTADVQILENLFTFMNEKYGAGARLLNRAEERKIQVTE